MTESLFGGGSSDFEPTRSTSARTPAFRLSSNFDDGNVSTSLTRLGSPAQRQFDARFPRILSNVDALRSTIRPGFSQLREARLNRVQNARARGIGNLRENLARRRVAGSSFANDQLIRAEGEFGQLAAEEEAKSFLEELQANQTLLGFESQQLFTALQQELQELGVASNFASASADLFSRDNMFASNLQTQEAVATGRFLGDITGLLAGTGVALATGNPFAGAAAGQATSSAVGGSGSPGGAGSGFNPNLAVLR